MGSQVTADVQPVDHLPGIPRCPPDSVIPQTALPPNPFSLLCSLAFVQFFSIYTPSVYLRTLFLYKYTPLIYLFGFSFQLG